VRELVEVLAMRAELGVVEDLGPAGVAVRGALLRRAKRERVRKVESRRRTRRGEGRTSLDEMPKSSAALGKLPTKWSVSMSTHSR